MNEDQIIEEIKKTIQQLIKKHGRNFYDQIKKFVEETLFLNFDFENELEPCTLYHILVGSSPIPKKIKIFDLPGDHSIQKWINETEKAFE